jgi:sugar phosphate isomerase/epimerase
MDTHDAQKRTLEQQAEMLAKLGFDGAGHVGLDNVGERLRTLDDVGLRLFLVGLRIDVTDADRPYLSKMQEVLPLLKDRDVLMYLTIGGLQPSDVSGDEIAVPLLREIARIAAESRVRVALYPHTGDWLVRVDHAVRLAKQVDRPHLGVMFNLCHFLRNEDISTLESVITSAKAHLFAVSINGADPAGRVDGNWRRLIQPLDRGTFDTYGLLNLLADEGYAGPVALMCYGIGGDAREHLARSINRWRQLQTRLAESRP